MTSFDPSHTYDIIFAGGGTSACVAAGRLAAADPSLSILIIERGLNNLNDPLVTNPGIFAANLAPGAERTLFYEAEEEEDLTGSKRVVATGGCLGGGSSINALIYTRAQARDYDAWGVEGWKYKDILPYAKKLETLTLEDPTLDRSVHGFNGPVEISMGTHAPNGPMDDFLTAAKSYGYREITDLQDFTASNAFTKSAKYIDREGKRQDAAHRYIHPLMADGKHPNLHLLLESRVRHVVFEEKKAVGVEYEADPAFSKEGVKNTAKIVKAKKMVVVSAGALGTPLILERSGIGKKELLESLDIPVISDLSGVGENYQDHHFLLAPYKTKLKPEETLDGLFTKRLDFVSALKSQNPILGWNACDIAGKLRMTDEEAAALGPEFKKAWDRDFANDPSKPIMVMGGFWFLIGAPYPEKEEEMCQYATMANCTAYPYSRGSIHITSRDTDTKPKFITGYLSDPHSLDLKISVWAYKKFRDIYRRTNAFAGEYTPGHPQFRDGSKAALSEGPLKDGGFKSVEDMREVSPIEYDEQDDKAIEEFVRERVGTTYHSLGTCRMGKREDGSVVDKHLNVYGVEGLKCVDLSIVPENVGANTNNTALIVGEKAADIIGMELGITV